VKEHWWRVAFVVATTLVMAGFAWREALVGVFAVVPMLVWCGGVVRADRAGLVGGLVLLAAAAWLLLPRDLGVSDRWVPSVFEVCVFLPIVTAAVCAAGRRTERSGRWALTTGLATFAVAGLLVAGYTVVSYSEGATGDEVMWPGPAGLRIVESDEQCASGGCARQFDATGEHAAERVRAYLVSRGFTPRVIRSQLPRTHTTRSPGASISSSMAPPS
jgi:hypothetical protein